MINKHMLIQQKMKVMLNKCQFIAQNISKLKQKIKIKQDICNKILYEDASKLDYSDSEYNSSSTCMYNQILSIFYFILIALKFFC